MTNPTLPLKIDKPWGHEVIWAQTDRYVGKILQIRSGEVLSLQYHEHKDETVYVLAGEMLLHVDGLTTRLVEGTGYRIAPLTRHRMTALRDCTVLEASTPELDDIVRLSDRYGRV